MIIEIKSKESIKKFVEVGNIAGAILKNIISKIAPGITGKDLDTYTMEECERNSVTPVFLNYRGFPSCICISKNHTLVHGIPDKSPFHINDIISIDFGISIDGFIGDVAETIVLKDKSEFNGNELINSCRFALWSAIQKAKTGNKLSDISKEIENVAGNRFQIPKEYGGHGINRNILHASPYVPNIYHEGNDDIILRRGMILAIEPMFIDSKDDAVSIGEDDWSVVAKGNTAHFEHTILITDGDPLVLTDDTNTFYNEGYKW